jgi:hypothetical protein
MKRIRALFFDSAAQLRLAVALVWLLLHFYAGRPLLALAAYHDVVPAIVWAALTFFAGLSLLPFFVHQSNRYHVRTIVNWAGYAVMSVFSLLLVFVLAGDLAHGVNAALRFASGVLTHDSVAIRSLDAAKLNAGIFTTAGLLAALGLLQARRPRLRSVDVPIDKLPEEFDGYRLVQWSDVHISATIQHRFVRSLVNRTNALNPDAVVITGDLIDGHLEHHRRDVASLAEIDARDGVFYVTGNHEYYWQPSAWIPHLESLGLTFLKNEHRVVERGTARLAIAGVTDPAGRDDHKPDLAAALRGVPREAVKVLLAHRPQAARDAATHGVALQLSGHTHGGQYFPFSLLIRFFQPIVAGLHKVGETWLYVSRGTGYWGPPSRLFVGAEITVVTLRRG